MAYEYHPATFIKDFRQGEEGAILYVYQKLSGPLYSYAMNRTHDQQKASDMVGHCFMRMLYRRQEFNSFKNIKQWSYIVVRNQFIDGWRKNRRTPTTGDDFILNGIAADPFAEMEMEALKSLLLNKILDDIEDLAPQRKRVIKLYFFEQKTTEEIAAITGLCPQTVLNHKTRAIDALKYKFLQEKDHKQLLIKI